MKINKLVIALFLAANVAAPAAHAHGFNIGILAGQSNLDELAVDACNDSFFASDNFFASATCLSGDDDLAFGINLAYYFTDFIGVEGGYINLGESSVATISPLIDVPFGFSPPLQTTVFSTNVVYGALVGTLPLSDRLSLSGRAGVYEASIDAEFDNGFSYGTFELESTTDSYFGASINFAVTRNVELQLRYDDFDVEVTSLGLTYSFW